MKRVELSAVIVPISLAAAACGPVTNGLTPVSNPSLYSVNQPVVERTNYVLDLASSGGRIAATERDRLASWFRGLELGYGDRVFIDQRDGYENASARHDVSSVAADFGLLVEQGAPVTAGTLQPGDVRVIVARATAHVPGCPIWADEMVGAPERTSTNYGCAVNSNLAAMIADPNDLVLGQSVDGGGDPTTTTKAIKHYRDAVPTGGKLEAATGKGSNK